ncbi:hypothetical protein [Scytonema sp. PCC 10023]|uniref:hypothetical protein n=1 Tax=Scytonema sp. PCC 10023 TaxID=1680591 RepID=UPI0039C73D14
MTLSRAGGGFKPALRVSPEPAARLTANGDAERKAHAPRTRTPLALLGETPRPQWLTTNAFCAQECGVSPNDKTDN